MKKVKIQTYPFLSLDYPAAVTVGNTVYSDVRAAILAAKLKNEHDRVAVVGMQGLEAENAMKNCKIREDWDDVKQDIINDIMLSRFLCSPILKAKLLNIEGSVFIDGSSENLLGNAVSYAYNVLKDTINQKGILNGRIVFYSNGYDGIPPRLIIEGNNDKKYMVTVDNNRFLLSDFVDSAE